MRDAPPASLRVAEVLRDGLRATDVLRVAADLRAAADRRLAVVLRDVAVLRAAVDRLAAAVLRVDDVLRAGVERRAGERLAVVRPPVRAVFRLAVLALLELLLFEPLFLLPAAEDAVIEEDPPCPCSRDKSC